MSQAILNTSASTLELINDVADTVKRKYGATKALAVHLCTELASFTVYDANMSSIVVEWFDIEHSDTREAAKPTLEVAQAFRDALRKAGHKNPSVEWKRVRDEGRNHTRALAIASGEIVEGEDDGESNGANTKRGLNLRLIEELTKLYKACKKDEKVLSDEQSSALVFITSALDALHVDPSMIK
jgi:hypothetical protein